MKDEQMWFLYLIECKTPNHYYVGITSQLITREERHRSCRGAQFTQVHGVRTFEVLATYPTLAEALKAEYDLTRDGGVGSCGLMLDTNTVAASSNI